MKTNLTKIGLYAVGGLFLIGILAAFVSSTNVRIFLGILAGIIGLLAIFSIPRHVRINRARKIFQTLPKNVKERVLDLIEEAAGETPLITYLLLDDQPCSQPEAPVQSHVGGLPYAESGETWPAHRNAVPRRFLLQVRLDQPSLPQQWQGRLIALYFVLDSEQIVRSYAAPSLQKYAPISSSIPPFKCVRLRSLPFPAASKDDPTPMSPARICEYIPEIQNLLSPFTRDCSGLLSQILRPNVYGYDLEAPEIAYQGGSPMLIQNPHDPACDHCKGPMRFLFQFGELIPGLQLADAGVGYVYGCDHHPDHCKAFIDSH